MPLQSCASIGEVRAAAQQATGPSARKRMEGDWVGLLQMTWMGLNHRKAPSGVPQASGLADIIRTCVCEKQKVFKLFTFQLLSIVKKMKLSNISHSWKAP